MKKLLIIAILALSSFAFSGLVTQNDAVAQVTGTSSGDDIGNFGKFLCEIAQALRGNIGRAIAIIVIVFLGIGAFFGKLNWGTALITTAGIILIFSAPEILKLVLGDEGTDCAGL